MMNYGLDNRYKRLKLFFEREIFSPLLSVKLVTETFSAFCPVGKIT